MLCSTTTWNCAVRGGTITPLGTMLAASLLSPLARGGSRDAPENIRQKEGDELLISPENLSKWQRTVGVRCSTKDLYLFPSALAGGFLGR